MLKTDRLAVKEPAVHRGCRAHYLAAESGHIAAFSHCILRHTGFPVAMGCCIAGTVVMSLTNNQGLTFGSTLQVHVGLGRSVC